MYTFYIKDVMQLIRLKKFHIKVNMPFILVMNSEVAIWQFVNMVFNPIILA